MKKIAIGLAVSLLVGIAVITVMVEREGEYVHEYLGGEGKGKALVLFHPSLDARFSDDLSLALVEGLKAAGLTVERATLTSRTPARPQGYDIICVVSNTYYWTPDLPTLSYLKRAQLEGIPVIGLIGGAGDTGRSHKVFEQALRKTGASVRQVRSFWLWRPNTEDSGGKPNRQTAMDQARQLGLDAGKAVSKVAQ